MSTLVVSNISDGTTTVAASYVTNGSAKAWVNFNGTGTIAARDSLNLSSLTDNGTGYYSVNFSSSMGNSNYAWHHSSIGSYQRGIVNDAFWGQVTGSVSFTLRNETNGAATDEAWLYVSVLGDLA